MAEQKAKSKPKRKPILRKFSFSDYGLTVLAATVKEAKQKLFQLLKQKGVKK